MSSLSIFISLCFTIFVLKRTIKSLSAPFILRLAIVFFYVLWIIIPGVGLFYNFYSNNSNISLEVPLLYFLESFIINSFVLLFVSKKHIFEFPLVYIKESSFYILSIVYIYYLYSISGIGYLESNDISGGLNSGIFPFFMDILHGYILLAAITTSNKRVMIISFSLLFAFIIITLQSGGRISMLILLFVFVYRYMYLFKFNIRIIIILSITSIFLLQVANEVVKLRSTTNYHFSDINIFSNFSYSFHTLFEKFNGYNNGVDLIQGYSPGSAGLKPYYGSLLMMIPRAVLESKPVAGSITPDRAGQPSRLVPKLYNPNDDINNVTVSPLAISIWHWGWFFGPLIFGLFGYFNLILMRRFISSQSIFLRSLSISLIPLPGSIYIFPSPEIFVKNLVVLLTMYLALLTVNKNLPKKKFS